MDAGRVAARVDADPAGWIGGRDLPKASDDTLVERGPGGLDSVLGTPTSHRGDLAALRLRLIATKNLPCTEFPDKNAEGQYPENVILDFDYWALMPRRR